MATHNVYNRGPYNHTRCGNKWFFYTHTRYFSGGWEFDTFKEGIAWCKQQLANHKKNDPNEFTRFDCYANGPGGQMDRSVIGILIGA